MCDRCEMMPPDVDLLGLAGPDADEQAALRALRHKRQRVLDLLALVENPAALPAGDAMRIGQEILVLLDELGDHAPAAAQPGLPRLRPGTLPAFKSFA